MSRKTQLDHRRLLNKGVFLYGNINKLSNAVAYCDLHKCYLSPDNIKKKKCNYKRCINLIELDKSNSCYWER